MSCFCSFTEIPYFHRFSKQCSVLNQFAQGMRFLHWPVRACVKATLLLGLVWHVKTVNPIILRQTGTASQEKGKSAGAPRKTTACQESTLLRMVCEDCFRSAPALTERMRNLYGVRVGWKILKKLSLTANSRQLRLNWHAGGRTWPWLLVPTPSGEMSHDFSCTLSMAAWEFVDWREKASSKISMLPGPKLEGFCPCLWCISQGCQITPCAPR